MLKFDEVYKSPERTGTYFACALAALDRAQCLLQSALREGAAFVPQPALA